MHLLKNGFYKFLNDLMTAILRHKRVSAFIIILLQVSTNTHFVTTRQQRKIIRPHDFFDVASYILQEYLKCIQRCSTMFRDCPIVLPYSAKWKSLTNFDEWLAIRQSFPFNFSCQYFSYEGYNQFVKVLLVKVSDMLDSSNFVRLFHRQSFALHGTQICIQLSNN